MLAVKTGSEWVSNLFADQADLYPKLLKALSAAAACAVVVDVVRRLLGVRRLYKRLEACPTAPGFSWISGSMVGVPKDPEGRLDYEIRMVKQFPKCYVMWFGPMIPMLKVHHPETMKVILKSLEPKNKHSGGYKHLRPWLGEGLLIADGARWARSRRLLTPAFHFDILKPYVAIYNQCCDKLLEKIDIFAESGESFDIYNLITHCTLDIILRCAMSYDSDVQNCGDAHPYLQAVKEMLAISTLRILNPILNPNFIFYRSSHAKKFLQNCKYVHGIAENIIETRRKTLETGGLSQKQHLDFLDILLTAKDENGVGLTKLEIRNEVDTFLFEGHDTTASAISWTLYSMAEHQEFQTQIQEELDSVIGDNTEVRWEDLSELNYLTLCVKESLRYHSPVPFLSRRLAREVVFDGVSFPVGTVIIISVYGLHNNPHVWSEPEVFDPDRFLPDNISKMDQYAFLPFVAGPRNCIGQHFAMNEDKVVVARVLKRYHLEVDPTHEVKRSAMGIMKAQTGLWVKATPRHRH
ncbi:cytochrome P450 4F2-like [Gigantopelta aegis]|uniref:cytochrome P450 4F2-like n=1 Tax=Gigantopelta aegis TaxID=1735272 RepID=UPI001B888A2F|nr:cytochrome P450 4F2-like [Gigantopelta aegis]XP_041377561.1 cytochrome P450 4F2-like [Gigantopelta aegis]